MQIFIDGGFRTGNDILKAYSLGADFVFLGRPVLFGLAVEGQQGILLLKNSLSQLKI